MSTIASKNLYELLGNDPELDPDRPADPPTKVIDKPVARVGKRNAGPEAPAAAAAETARAPTGPTGGRGGRTEGERLQRREGARDDNRERGERRPYRGDNNYRGRGEGRGRGGRGRGDRPPRDDRHSHTGVGDHAKQAAHGWGAEQDGNAELADEKAGEAIASAETKNEPGFSPDTNGADPAFTTGPDGETGVDAAEEEKTKTYDQYLAELAEKRLALGGGIEVRKANEGSKQKVPEGNAFTREEQDFFVGTGGKARKAKETVAKKEQVVIDGQYYAPAESGDRGGSRGGRGGRGGPRGGRGEFRGDRGGRGRGRGGDFRGGARGSGERTGPSARGGAGFNATDESAFPALGGN